MPGIPIGDRIIHYQHSNGNEEHTNEETMNLSVSEKTLLITMDRVWPGWGREAEMGFLLHAVY